jgi:hypothetical protein
MHARQQAIAMVDTETGESTEKTLDHEGNAVRVFYAALEGPVLVPFTICRMPGPNSWRLLDSLRTYHSARTLGQVAKLPRLVL